MDSKESPVSCDPGTRTTRASRSVTRRGRGRKKAGLKKRSTRSTSDLSAGDQTEHDTEDSLQESSETLINNNEVDDSSTLLAAEEITVNPLQDVKHNESAVGEEYDAVENGVEEEMKENEAVVYVLIDKEESVVSGRDEILEDVEQHIEREVHKIIQDESHSGHNDAEEFQTDGSMVNESTEKVHDRNEIMEVPELEESPPPSITAVPSVRSGLRLKAVDIPSPEESNHSQNTEDEADTHFSGVEEANLCRDSAESFRAVQSRSQSPSNGDYTKHGDMHSKEVINDGLQMTHEENNEMKGSDAEGMMEIDENAEDGYERNAVKIGTAQVEDIDIKNIEIQNEHESAEMSGEREEEENNDYDGTRNAVSQVEEEEAGDSNMRTEPDTEMVSEDELPAESSKEPLETEAVSDEELPDPSAPVGLPETEAVSEDELPPEKTDKKRKAASASKKSEESGSKSSLQKKKRKRRKLKSSAVLVKSESQKRKLADGDTYDPSSPTSENSCDESPAVKRAAIASGATAAQAKPVVKIRKSLPELDKYWKAVKEDSTDFTGWTYLLQYVDQENDIEAAREAYDAFLSHYPYCYGYWRKYADYEKRKGSKEKCEHVFERGLKAIPLSVDLWIHYLNYCKASYPDDEEHLRSQFEKGIAACGMEFRSDRLWESYIKWELDGKKLQNVTMLYDRLLAVPTQGYTNHFDSFQEHISSNPPQKILSVDEFLTLRREVLQLLKQYEQPLTSDDAAPGEETEVPPGEESEEQTSIKSDEETTALRERIIAIRRKIHKTTVSLVADRWNYEEGIKRPYFHVKPLERCQLKNWKEYLDYEIEQGDSGRIIVLFERCLIACALYEEFWMKYIRYLESLNEDATDKIRNAYERACLIHHPKKPNLHLHWAVFEESQQNYDRAAEILLNLEKLIPNMLQVAYRRINLERRRNDLGQVCSLYEHYINTSKNKVIANNMAIKYARFSWKILGDVEKAISILNKAVEKDKDNPRLYLQLIDMGLQKSPVNEAEIVSIIDQFLSRDCDLEQKVLFAQRKVEFMEDFGSDVLGVQRAHDEFQKYFKLAKDRKKRSPDLESKLNCEGSTTKKTKMVQSSGAEPLQQHASHASSQSPHGGSGQQPPQTPNNTQTSAAAGSGTGTSQYTAASYTQSSGYSQQTPPQSSYQSSQYPATGPQQAPAPYSQPPYNQQYNQSGDPNYANYQNWGYSQTGYGGYNQGWGNYNYY